MFVVGEIIKISQLFSQKSDSFAIVTNDAFGVLTGEGTTGVRLLSRSKDFGQIERIHPGKNVSFEEMNIHSDMNDVFVASGDLSKLFYSKYTSKRNNEVGF